MNVVVSHRVQFYSIKAHKEFVNLHNFSLYGKIGLTFRNVGVSYGGDSPFRAHLFTGALNSHDFGLNSGLQAKYNTPINIRIGLNSIFFMWRMPFITMIRYFN